MADSIQPWIASYLIDVAEKYGADMQSIPTCQKRKKVQLTEWLTYGDGDENSLLWARISDKQHIIPIRFNSEAIAEYNRLNSGKRITQQKTALIFIKDYKPIFTRVPRGGNMKLSSHCVLAIECDSISLFGSFDEARFGSPREVEANVDLNLWSEGLKHAGGGGNILKQRKDGQDNAVMDIIPKAVLMPPPKSITIPAQKTGSSANAPVSTSSERCKANHLNGLPRKRAQLFPRFKRELRWRGSSQDATSIDAMSVDLDHGDDPGMVHQNDPGTSESHTLGANQLQQAKADVAKSPEKARTPSHSPQLSQKIQSRESTPGIPITEWSPSPPVSRKPRSPGWAATMTQSSPIPSSHPIAPTPAQRPKDKRKALPPSSPTSESEIVAHETVLLPRRAPVHINGRYPVIRKVPRPPQPVPPDQFDSGLTQILVPNSDTSLSYSQSQPQSQSHSLDEVSEISQPVVLSQLSALAEPRQNLNDPFVDNADTEMNRDGSMFSGSFKEDAYEGDQSSLQHGIKESPRTNQTYLNSSPSHSHRDSDQEDLTNASTIAQPAATQHDDRMDDDNARDVIVHPVKSQTQRDVGFLSANHPDPMDVTHELDEDDAQIHHQLFGTSQSQASSQQRPHAQKYAHDSTGSTETHADTDQSRLVIISPADAVPDNPQPITEGEITHDGTPEIGVGMVQHDANAWSAPSFLRPSSSATTVTKSEHSKLPFDLPLHALGKSKAANANSTSRLLKASLGRDGSFNCNRSPRVDQNQDPGAPCVPVQPKKPAQAQKKAPLPSALTSLQPRPNKRRKDTSLDADSIELSRPHTKKRRVEQAADAALIGTKNERRKLKGFHANLNRIELDKKSMLPVVTWPLLTNILLDVGRDRGMEIQL